MFKLPKPDAAPKQLKHRHQNEGPSDLWILDGGTGREIERRGGPFRQPEWSALALYEKPDIVRDIHKSYIDAGSNAITTNTYAVVPFHIGRERYDKDAKWLLDLAVDLAVQARGDRKDVQIMGSVPPITGSYEPGKFDEAIVGPILQDFLGAFRGKVDAILLETIGSVQEAKFALEQVKKSGVDLPVYLSFHVDASGSDENKPRLLTGDTLGQAMEQLMQTGLLHPDRVPLVMVNCCDVKVVDEALRELASALDIATSGFRIGAYPNAFSAPPAAAANEKVREVDHSISPSFLKSVAKRWISEYGARAVGGCCGIGPDHIKAVAELKTTAGSLDKNRAGVGQDLQVLLPPEQPYLATMDKPLLFSCGIQGCGCGVQSGFGQGLPRLCEAVSTSE